MNKPHHVLLRLAAGLAIGLWGISKLLYVNDWVMPYGMFYPVTTIGASAVYVLAIIEILLGAGIILSIQRKPAAWIASFIAAVSLVATIIMLIKTGLANPPAPYGVKLVWFIFNPLAILLLLIGIAMHPEEDA